MGEEWGAQNPFLFFVDFSDDPDLSRAVREGRAREFANFKSFAEQHGERQIPDPTLEETFVLSRLDWDEAARPPHRDVRAEVRALLRLRQAKIVPLLKSGFVGAEARQAQPETLDVTWTFKAGRLRLVANFGRAEAAFERGDDRILWASPSAAVEQGRIRLPAWTGAVLRSEPA